MILACNRPGRPPWVVVGSSRYEKGDAKKTLTESEFEALWNGLQAEHLEKLELVKSKVPSSITEDNYLLMSGETWNMAAIP